MTLTDIVPQAVFDRFHTGLTEGFGKKMKTMANSDHFSSQEEFLEAVESAGRKQGEKLAIQGSPKVLAESSQFDANDAKQLEEGYIPPAFYNNDTSGLFDNKGLSTLLNFMANHYDANEVNYYLTEKIESIFARELMIEDDDEKEWLPFYLNMSTTEAAEFFTQTRIKEYKTRINDKIIDINEYLSTSDDYDKYDLKQSMRKKWKKDIYASYGDTLNQIINDFVDAKVTEAEAITGLIRLQRAIRAFKREAQRTLGN